MLIDTNSSLFRVSIQSKNSTGPLPRRSMTGFDPPPPTDLESFDMIRIRSITLYATVLLAASAATAQVNDTLAKVKAAGAITIGSRDSSVPFSYRVTGDSDPIGFTNEICLKIVEAVKAKLKMPQLGRSLHHAELDQPHPADPERHRGPGLRDHDEHAGSPAAGCLRSLPLRHAHHGRGQEGFGHHVAGRSQGQDGRDGIGQHVDPVAAQLPPGRECRGAGGLGQGHG